MIEIVPYTTREKWLEDRKMDVTSTEVSALISQNPYLTLPELYYLKAGKITSDFVETERSRWGLKLQKVVAESWAADEGAVITEAKDYYRDPACRAGASFDYFIGDQGVLEIKTVDQAVFRDNWIVNGDAVEAPVFIELQLMQQIWLSGRQFGIVACLVGGNKLVTLRREPDPKVIELLKEKISAFFFAIGAGQEPALNPTLDTELISRLYRYATPGKVLDARQDEGLLSIATRYKELGDSIKSLEMERDALKAETLLTIGDAEKVLGSGYSISAGVVASSRVEAYDRKEYRSFRVNFSKGKK